MGAFQYQALKKTGNPSKGVIEADSERHARQLLREQGLIPISIQAYKKLGQTKQKDKLNAANLALFTRQLATLLAAGIPIDEALRGVADQSEVEGTHRLIIGVRAKVLEGYGLAQAMGEYPHAFPELYRATLAAGEHTGRLDLVLEKLADYTENQQTIRQKIQQALIYPCIMIVISTTIIGFLLAYVVPDIVGVFANSGQKLPSLTIILIALSNFIKHDGLYVLLLVVILGIVFQRSLKNPKILWQWHQTILKMPLVGFVVKTVNVARYIHTFGILFSAGGSVLETMRVSASLVNNSVMRHAFDQATTDVWYIVIALVCIDPAH